MKTKFQALLKQEMFLTSGVAYLVPIQWWIQFCQANHQAQGKEELIYPPLNLENYVNAFLLEYKEIIREELKIDKVFISPQINKEFVWKFVSTKLWHNICHKSQQKFGLLSLYNKQQDSQNLQQKDIQIQIIFSSKPKTTAFIGFLPYDLDVTFAIRSIGFQLGFIELPNSMIAFPDKNPKRPYYFCQMEQIPLHQSQDTLFLVYNLEYLEEKDEKVKGFDFSFKNQDIINLNQAFMEDITLLPIKCYDEVNNNGVASTEPETPEFFHFEEWHSRQFKATKLFGEKNLQQIKLMKSRIRKINNDELIGINVTQNQKSLQNIACQLIEYIDSHQQKMFQQQQNFHL